MRVAVGVVLVAGLLAGCGGDTGARKEGESAVQVVRSADGRAELELPAGVDGNGVSIEERQVEGAAVAFTLSPSGSTFDEPARLTIRNVRLPAGGVPVGMALVRSDDGAVEPVDLDTEVEPGATVATVVLAVPHFSWVALFWEPAGVRAGRLVYSVGSVHGEAPASAPVGEPFEVKTVVTAGPVEYLFADTDDLPEDQRTTIAVTAARLRGSLTAVDAAPASVADVPASGPITGRFERTTTFRCAKVGIAAIGYLARIELDYRIRSKGQERTGTLVHRVRVKDGTECVDASASTPTSSSISATGPVKPTVSAIRVLFERPVTTYLIEATEPDALPLTYLWRMSGENCGTPRTPWERKQRAVQWSHADTPPDACAHASPEHDVTISVTVSSSRGSVTCTFAGTEARVITNPTCS